MEEKILGQWGRMRRAYLMEHRPATYSTMVMRGELFLHLYQVDEQGDLILRQMQEHNPAPDRHTDPMAWFASCWSCIAGCGILSDKKGSDRLETLIRASGLFHIYLRVSPFNICPTGFCAIF